MTEDRVVRGGSNNHHYFRVSQRSSSYTLTSTTGLDGSSYKFGSDFSFVAVAGGLGRQKIETSPNFCGPDSSASGKTRLDWNGLFP